MAGKEVAAANGDEGRCGQPTRRGGKCRQFRPCRMHARAEASAWGASATIPITPAEAMRLLMNVSWLRWQVYSDMLHGQIGAARQRTGTSADNGTPKGAGGLVGHKLTYSKEGRAMVTGEEIRALTVLEAEERDRCARLVKLAHDMGVEDMGDWTP